MRWHKRGALLLQKLSQEVWQLMPITLIVAISTSASPANMIAGDIAFAMEVPMPAQWKLSALVEWVNTWLVERRAKVLTASNARSR